MRRHRRHAKRFAWQFHRKKRQRLGRISVHDLPDAEERIRRGQTQRRRRGVRLLHPVHSPPWKTRRRQEAFHREEVPELPFKPWQELSFGKRRGHRESPRPHLKSWLHAQLCPELWRIPHHHHREHVRGTPKHPKRRQSDRHGREHRKKQRNQKRRRRPAQGLWPSGRQLRRRARRDVQRAWSRRLSERRPDHEPLNRGLREGH